jgi:hypothetical protein
MQYSRFDTGIINSSKQDQRHVYIPVGNQIFKTHEGLLKACDPAWIDSFTFLNADKIRQ